MKRLLSLFLMLLISLSVFAQSPDSILTIKEMQQEALEHNKAVADQEMVEFFELIYKYHPKNIAGFQNQTPEERETFLEEMRIAHDKAGMKLSTLRGLDEDKLREMDELARWDAEQSLLVEDAFDRLQNYSTKEYRIIVEEAAKMVSNYDPSSADHLGRQTFFENFPTGLAFIRPDMIHVGEDWCLIYLQKGVGRGIGYSIDQNDSGEWSIAWFNEYADWGRTTIDLERSAAN